MQVATTGLVLRQVKVGEADRILTIPNVLSFFRLAPSPAIGSDRITATGVRSSWEAFATKSRRIWLVR